jgi:hypothetical protein
VCRRCRWLRPARGHRCRPCSSSTLCLILGKPKPASSSHALTRGARRRLASGRTHRLAGAYDYAVMPEAMQPNPSVFLTWAHRDAGWEDADEEAWAQQVAAFAYVLRGYGIDADVDLFHQTEPGIDWTRWGPKQITDSVWVIVLLSRGWQERWEGRNVPTVGAGAVAEADALKSEFNRDQQSFRRKVVLVTLPGREDADLVPVGLDGVARFGLLDYSPPQLGPLLRLLTGQPQFPPGPLGALPELPPFRDVPVGRPRTDAAAPSDSELSSDELSARADDIDRQRGALQEALRLMPKPVAAEGSDNPSARARHQLTEQLADLEHESLVDPTDQGLSDSESSRAVSDFDAVNSSPPVDRADPLPTTQPSATSPSAELLELYPELSMALESAFDNPELRSILTRLNEPDDHAREALARGMLSAADDIQSAVASELADLTAAEARLAAAEDAAIEAEIARLRPGLRNRISTLSEEIDGLERQQRERMIKESAQRDQLDELRSRTRSLKAQLAMRLIDDPSLNLPERTTFSRWKRLTSGQRETQQAEAEIEQREYEYQDGEQRLRQMQSAISQLVTDKMRVRLELERLNSQLTRVAAQLRPVVSLQPLPEIESAKTELQTARQRLRDATVTRGIVPRCESWLTDLPMPE